MDKLSSSPRINSLLHHMGIFSYLDILEHLPRRYEFLDLSKESDFINKNKVTVFGKIISPISLNKGYHTKSVSFSIYVSYLKRSFNVIAFNREYLTKSLSLNQEITMWGIYDYKLNQINLINYLNGSLDDKSKIKPIYSLPTSLENHNFVRLVAKSLKELEGKVYSLVPYYYQNKYRLISKYDSYKRVHFPTTKEDIRQGLRHLKYEEALLFSLKNKIIRESNKSLAKVKKNAIGLDLCKHFIALLPFKLSIDQMNAANEIIEDMNQSSLMYRLLQGDVGTGKTVVSFVALYANYLRGDQGAIMAPTDALARQHYKVATEMFNFSKMKIALLLGSTPLKEKERIYRDLLEGDIDLVIGTHALFTKKAQYSSLGLVVIDEQHRFGVNQRQALLDKGEHADLLMMSATPIPRSLALTIYGDLDITTLYHFPTTNKDITTKVIEDNGEIYQQVDKALALNQKIYVVAPLISVDESRYSAEELYERYHARYGDKVALLHGDLSHEEKEKALESFTNGTTPILVATQVIEVGIDVKNASLMVIYDATNFGLASLHQLRGRIGRDGTKALCLLVVSDLNDDRKDKLDILVNSFDGFKIAEEDMKNRGPGDLTGIRQSGIPNFKYLNVIDDLKIFITARDDASYIYAHPEEKQFSYMITRAKWIIEHTQSIKA